MDWWAEIRPKPAEQDDLDRLRPAGTAIRRWHSQHAIVLPAPPRKSAQPRSRAGRARPAEAEPTLDVGPCPAKDPICGTRAPRAPPSGPFTLPWSSMCRPRCAADSTPRGLPRAPRAIVLTSPPVDDLPLGLFSPASRGRPPDAPRPRGPHIRRRTAIASSWGTDPICSGICPNNDQAERGRCHRPAARGGSNQGWVPDLHRRW